MKITYICPNRTLEIKGDTLYSSLASERYRIINPSEALHKRGHEINMNFEPVKGNKVDVVFMGKFLTSPKPWLNSIKEYKDAGAKIVWDMCDNYIELYKRTPDFSELLELADKFTCPSVSMGQILEENMKQWWYIPDAPEMQYRKAGSNTGYWDYLWYGQVQNLKALIGAKFPEGASLQLITRAVPEDAYKFLTVNTSFTSWSLQTMQKALNVGKRVLIPAKLDDPWYQTKSANRALEAVWTGNPVIAHRIPEYEYIGLPGIYFIDSIDYANYRFSDDGASDLWSEIEEGQSTIRDTYLLDKTVLEWEKAFV